MGQPFPSTPSFSLSKNEFGYFYFNSGHDQESKFLYKTVRNLISRPLRILKSGERMFLILLGRHSSWVLRCNNCSSTIVTTRNGFWKFLITISICCRFFVVVFHWEYCCSVFVVSVGAKWKRLRVVHAQINVLKISMLVKSYPSRFV